MYDTVDVLLFYGVLTGKRLVESCTLNGVHCVLNKKL